MTAQLQGFRNWGVAFTAVSLGLILFYSLLSSSAWTEPPVPQAKKPASAKTAPAGSKIAPVASKTTPMKPPAQGAAGQVAPVKVVNADLIRVGISDDEMTNFEYPAAKLSATGAFDVIEQGTGKVVYTGKPRAEVSFRRDKQGLWPSVAGVGIKGAPFSGVLVLKPKDPASRVLALHVTRRGNAPSYRGVLEVVPGYSSPLKFSVVNVLLMQDYLKAVVPNELPIKYGVEAVKAQSVAARNYAVRPREKPWPQFDICDSQYCQAYYGAQTESPQTTQALADTEGLLALYHGEPILALYSSSHGGVGESYSNAFSDPKTNQFPATPLPYLAGGPDLMEIQQMFGDLRKEASARKFWMAANAPSYDVLSPHYRWKRHFSRVEMEAVLSRTLPALSKDKLTSAFVQPAFEAKQSLGELKDMDVTLRGVSGKAMTLVVKTSTGEWTIQKEFVIRKALAQGGKMLPSANIVVEVDRLADGKVASVALHGGGFGHGVGMSQLGASWMDKHGQKFPAILQHYYKGVAIGTRPLETGRDKGNLPMQTRFRSAKTSAVLWVARAQPANPVKIQINEKVYVIKPEDFHGNRVKVAVNHLMSGQLNTLTAYPDDQKWLKAWLEIYPAK